MKYKKGDAFKAKNGYLYVYHADEGDGYYWNIFINEFSILYHKDDIADFEKIVHSQGFTQERNTLVAKRFIISHFFTALLSKNQGLDIEQVLDDWPSLRGSS